MGKHSEWWGDKQGHEQRQRVEGKRTRGQEGQGQQVVGRIHTTGHDQGQGVHRRKKIMLDLPRLLIDFT